MKTMERRATHRMLTTIRVEALDGGPVLMAHDLSLGGMMVTTQRPRWPGCLLPVRFKLPAQPRAIRATCRVVDLVEVPVGVGLSLRFLRLAPEAQAAILRYMDKKPLPDYSDLSVSNHVAEWINGVAETCALLQDKVHPIGS